MSILQKIHISKKGVIITSVVIVALLIAGLIDYVQYINRAKMPDSHIFVCDNPENYSDFDNWLIDTVGVDKVPMYVIIYKDDVIGLINGNIPEKTFTNELGTILATGKSLCELPEFSISNIVNDTMTLKDIADKHAIVILEISWLTCKDCIEQDANFTKDIYSKYSTEQIYRYYLKSKKEDVIANRN